METQKQQCCVRECDSRDTHEHRGVGTDNLGRSMTFVVQLCEPCKDGILSKKVHYTFRQADSLVFVRELYP
ncbi:hypothetical protein C6503_19255 [Candidatus Poribacteria bacterium]|nr:MAG: hypothetical protein C6503_19255 [Candidatus Poribacteria bacterium]